MAQIPGDFTDESHEDIIIINALRCFKFILMISFIENNNTIKLMNKDPMSSIASEAAFLASLNFYIQKLKD